MAQYFTPDSPAVVNVRVPAATGWTYDTALAWREQIRSSLECELSLENDLGNGLHQVAVFTFTNLRDATVFIEGLGVVYSR